MTRLSNLYNLIEEIRNLADLGIHLDEDMARDMSQAEETLIRDEIVPILKQKIEPALQEVQRELVLVVDYKPGRPISVTLSRRRRLNETSSSATSPDAEASGTLSQQSGEDLGQPVPCEPSEPAEPHEPTRHVTNHTKGLRVTFPDGTTVCESKAIDTFKSVLKRIGFERVNQLGITHSGFNLVSREQRRAGFSSQHELDGWYIYSNISNEAKKDDLAKISELLNLNLTIENGRSE